MCETQNSFGPFKLILIKVAGLIILVLEKLSMIFGECSRSNNFNVLGTSKKNYIDI